MFFTIFIILSVICFNNSVDKGIKTARNSLGADLVVLPYGVDTDESVLYGGMPITLNLDRSVLKGIEDMKAVTECFPRLYLATLEGASCCDASIQIIGTDLKSDFILQSLTDKTALNDGEIIVGSRLGLMVGDTPKYFGHIFTVTDVLDKTGTGVDLSAYINMETAYQIAEEYPQLEMGTDDISAVFIRTDNAKALDNTIKSTFGKKIQVIALDKKNAEYIKTVSLIRKVTFVMVIFTVIIATLSLACLVYIHTIHRRNETGALLLYHFSRLKIISLYCKELFSVSIVSYIMAIILQILIFNSFTTLIENSIGMPISVNIVEMIPIYLLILIIMVITTIIMTVLSSLWIFKENTANLIKENN